MYILFTLRLLYINLIIYVDNFEFNGMILNL